MIAPVVVICVPSQVTIAQSPDEVPDTFFGSSNQRVHAVHRYELSGDGVRCGVVAMAKGPPTGWRQRRGLVAAARVV
ncbi:hypothetical protein GCM10010464_00190 [Pseudonocardia yunnanensis]